MQLHHRLWLLPLAAAFLVACERTEHAPTGRDVSAADYIAQQQVYNREAPIPPQCYTKTEGRYNPCYVCHQSYPGDKARPNVMRDGFLQGSYAFSAVGERNHWKNLFVDRRDFIAGIDDQTMREYIAQDNYAPLIALLKGDQWRGAVPEIRNLAQGRSAFDSQGLARDGSRWVAFNYKPMPATFWPTNGSTDDTMIRLPKAFSEVNGVFSRDLYFANLSLVEMAISGKQRLSSPPLNEAALAVDLNGDGALSQEATIVLRRANYLGDAAGIELAHMLYPEGTEFLHSVRYIGVSATGEVYPAPRMKELRYMQKQLFMPKERLANRYYSEFKEKHFENLPSAVDKGDRGVSNGFGWLLLGFIEDAQGTLRKQHREEQFYCLGCHTTIGTSIDQTFAFPRKLTGARGWGYIDLNALVDAANLGEVQGEYLSYLERVGGGDEFRQNREMVDRWFTADGQVAKLKVAALPTIYPLITPSPERAMQLNKAYLAVVREQSYLFGRDAVLSPARNVYQHVAVASPPLPQALRVHWDIRLDWPE